MVPEKVGSLFRDRRWRRFLPRLLAWLAALFVTFTLLGRPLFGSTTRALAVAAALTGAVSLGSVLYIETVWSDRPAGARRWVVVAFWAGAVGLCAGLMLRFWLFPPWWLCLAAGSVAALSSGVVYGRQSPRMVGAFQAGLAILRISSPEEARAVIIDCTRALDDPGLPADRRTVAELNRARARTMLALRRGLGHELQEALAVLRRTVQDPAVDPVLAVLAADDLVNAMSLAAEQTRDPQGYAEARRLLEHCLRRAPQVEASTRLYGHRAQFYLFLARDDPGYFPLALAAQQEAVRRAERPSAADLADLGVLLSLSGDRLGDAIAYCRRAYRLDRGDETRFSLALCLFHAVEAGGPEAEQRRAEAGPLLRRVARSKGPLGLRARQMLLDLGLEP